MQILVATLTLLLLVVACTSSPDPALEVAAFEVTGVYTDAEGRSQPCGFGIECFALSATADGTMAGTGLCEIWATDPDGERIIDEATWSSGVFVIEPGQLYYWEAQGSLPSDPEFRGSWDAVCSPAPRG